MPVYISTRGPVALGQGAVVALGQPPLVLRGYGDESDFATEIYGISGTANTPVMIIDEFDG